MSLSLIFSIERDHCSCIVHILHVVKTLSELSLH